MNKHGKFAAACVAVLCGILSARAFGGDSTEFVFTGSVDNSWSEPANWDPNGVPTATDDVSIPADKSVVASAPISCRNLALAGSLSFGDSPLTCGAGGYVFGTIAGNVELSGSAVLKAKAARPGSIDRSSVQAFQLSLYDQASTIRIGGALRVGEGTRVEVANDPLTGAPVIFRTGSLTVDEGGTVSADGGGFSWVLKTDEAIFEGAYTARYNYETIDYATFGDGLGSGYYGAGYGGAAGTVSATSGTGYAYGFETAPLLPGSPCGISFKLDSVPAGGGTVCVFADGAVTLNGTVSALGFRGAGGYLSVQGGSSGGAIWIAGDSVAVGDAAVVTADGNGCDSGNSSAGGGGRILLTVAAKSSDIEALLNGATPDELGLSREELALPQVTVAGGYNKGRESWNGKPGTKVRLYDANAMVIIRTPGVPGLVMEGLSYEGRILPPGPTAIDVPEYAYLASNPQNVRYSYAGCVISNAQAEVLCAGPDVRHVVFDQVRGEGPYVVYLKWANCENRSALFVPAEYGTFEVDGEDVGSAVDLWAENDPTRSHVIRFVPAPGCAFSCWSGTYPRIHSLGNPATVSGREGFSLIALVTGCTATGEAISWNGGTGRWEDAENWSGGKVPTLLDDVTITEGSVTISDSFVAGSLTLSGGTLTVDGTGGSLQVFGTVAGDVVLSGSAVLKAKAARPVSIDRTSAQTFQTSLYDQVGTIRIGGALQVGSGARVEVVNDPLTGAPVIFRTGSLTVDEGGTVSADGGGFAWVLKTDEAIFEDAFTARFNNETIDYATFGYGRGSGYSGSGYGGVAGGANKTTGVGYTYGFETAPVLPGSPCGLSFKPNPLVFPAGGGTVCVFADGAVTVNGTVSSQGDRGKQQGGSSGGAIWIAGASVSVGDTAVVTADGNGCESVNASGGGGGRILFTLATTPADIDELVDGKTPAELGLVQTDLALLQVTAAGGVDQQKSDRNGKLGTRVRVYEGVSHALSVVGGAFGSVAVNGSANVTGGLYWTPAGETDTLTAVPAAGCEFVCWRGDVPRDLCRAPTVVVSAATAVNVQAVFAPVSTEPTACHWKEGAKGGWYDVANWEEGRIPGSSDEVILASGQIAADRVLAVDSLTVSNGAALTVRDCREIVVARDLTLTSANSSLRIVSLPTDEANTWTNGATRVSVGGTFLIDDQATLYPESDEYTGGSPVFTCGAFFLAETAKVDASQLGFGGEVEDQRRVNLCPGGSGYAGSGAGGGYGGLGSTLARVEQYDAGHTYGLALSPIHPGAPNGVSENVISRSYRGGGLVRIHAGQMTVNGTVDASGQGWAYGGSSGGGIWLTCRKRDDFACGPSARLLVRGGNSHAHDAYKGFSCGGGGRIAVGVNLTEADCLAMIEAGAYPGRTKKHVFDRETFLSFYPGVTINVEPGYGDDPEKPWSDDPQYSGTFNFVDGQKLGLILIVR